MASRAVGFAASRSAGAADSETIVASGSRKTTTTVYTSDGSGGLKKESHTHVESSGSQDVHVAAMRRMEEKIRVLVEDLESEQKLRRRVEREKQDFQMQILSLSERLTEAQGGCESQADLNRRREAEMAKLRKLLEDVHT